MLCFRLIYTLFTAKVIWYCLDASLTYGEQHDTLKVSLIFLTPYQPTIQFFENDQNSTPIWNFDIDLNHYSTCSPSDCHCCDLDKKSSDVLVLKNVKKNAESSQDERARDKLTSKQNFYHFLYLTSLCDFIGSCSSFCCLLTSLIISLTNIYFVFLCLIRKLLSRECGRARMKTFFQQSHVVGAYVLQEIEHFRSVNCCFVYDALNCNRAHN